MATRSSKRTAGRLPSPRGSTESFHASVAAAVSAFGETVTPLLSAGSPESNLRDAFVQLLKAVGKPIERIVQAHGEVRIRELSIRPDYLIDVNGAPIGYVELKSPDRGIPNYWRPNTHERKQWAQLQLLPNVLFTNGNLFAVYRWGEQVGPVARLNGDIRRAGSALQPADASLATILHDFLSWKPSPQRNLGQLIRDSARVCRLVRDEIADTLRAERVGVAPRLFTDHLDDWRAWLFPQLTEPQFADAYAQTITFGLLLARRAGILFEGRNCRQSDGNWQKVTYWSGEHSLS